VSFDTDLVALLPNLRRYARYLTRAPDAAEDLVQDTVVRALEYRAHFQPGGYMNAWLKTIMYNLFITGVHKAKHVLSFIFDEACEGAQEAHIALLEVFAYADDPVHPMRTCTALMAEGFTIKEMAHAMGCSLGTVGSRQARVRAALREMVA
jgi:RNA polymerase sigma-70 factor, ECF subfamily